MHLKQPLEVVIVEKKIFYVLLSWLSEYGFSKMYCTAFSDILFSTL